LAANTLPAINDITAPELKGLLDAVSEVCPVIKEARSAAARVRGWERCKTSAEISRSPTLARESTEAPHLRHTCCLPSRFWPGKSSNPPRLTEGWSVVHMVRLRFVSWPRHTPPTPMEPGELVPLHAALLSTLQVHVWWRRLTGQL